MLRGYGGFPDSKNLSNEKLRSNEKKKNYILIFLYNVILKSN